MNKEKVEAMLVKHYKSKRDVTYMNLKLDECNRKINVYTDKIKNIDYKLGDTLGGVGYDSIRVKTSKISDPTLEELMKAHDAHVKYLENLREEKKEIESEIYILEGGIKALDHLIKCVPEAYAEIVLEQRFGWKKSYQAIGEMITYTHTSVINIEKRILDWLCSEVDRLQISFE